MTRDIWATRVLLNEEVAAKLESRDAEALNDVLASLGPQLEPYVYSLCRHRHEAEDLVQEVLLTVCLKLAQLRRTTHVKPWAFRIARNLVWMRNRKDRPVHRCEVRMGPEREYRDRRDRGPDFAAFLGEVRDTLDAAIRELPEIYRSVVLLRDVEGLTTAETAALLGISLDTVKTRLHRAHLELRGMLGRHHFADGTGAVWPQSSPVTFTG